VLGAFGGLVYGSLKFGDEIKEAAEKINKQLEKVGSKQ
jgi:hypothetical protein